MTDTQTACIKCGSGLESRLFCFSCKTIQRFISSELNFFEVLGLSIDFEIDTQELEEKYQNLSFALHPDFYGLKKESEKILSEKASSLLNISYKTLFGFFSRAEYLLNLFSHKKQLDQRSLPEGFLEETFILQESIDEFLEYGKESELLSLKGNLIAKQKNIEVDIALLFKKIKVNPNDLSIIQDLQTNLNALKYLFNLLERIN